MEETKPQQKKNDVSYWVQDRARRGGTLPMTYANVFNLTGSNLGNALNQIDGEAMTGAEHTAFELITQFLGFMLDPFVDGRFGSGTASGSQAIGFAPDEDQFLPPDVALAYAAILGKAAAGAVRAALDRADRGRLAWADDFVSNPSLGAAFATLPGTNFVVNGALIPNDSALLPIGAEFI